MTELYLPTTDHFEPTIQDFAEAIEFINDHKDRGERVYVHCRAGHGRSAAVVFVWLLTKNPTIDTQELNRELCRLRDVRKSLWKQPNVNAFLEKLKKKR